MNFVDTKKIREYIACPQFGQDHYGKWGALTYEQRFTILRLVSLLEYYEDIIENELKKKEKVMKNKITKEDIDFILSKSYITAENFGDKTTILKAVLPNGFVFVTSSSCVDPANFDMKIGEQLCMQKLEDKIWELEGYRLQCEVSESQGE